MISLDDDSLWAQADKFFDAHKSGCYRLIALGPGRAPLAIPRFLGSDDGGTLYIGTSSHVPNRLGSLRKSVSAAYGAAGYIDVAPHVVGRKIATLSRFRDTFELSTLAVTFEKCHIFLEDQSSGHFEQEAEQLRDYREKFGETPPLNG